MQDKILEELIPARMHGGPVFAFVRIQDNIIEEFLLPPPSKNITGSFFVSGINFVGTTGKIGNMVTGNNFWRINFREIARNFGGVSAQCEAI